MKLVSKKCMKAIATGGATLFPIAIPDVCLTTLDPKRTKLFVSTWVSNVRRSEGVMPNIFTLDAYFSIKNITASIPSLIGILPYRLDTSREKIIDPEGRPDGKAFFMCVKYSSVLHR